LVGILKNYGIETLPAHPDFEVLSKLVESTKVIPCSYHIGLICSSDAFYKEREESLLWAEKGVLAFEMECAGIFGVGYLRGVKTAAVLTVVDRISDTQEYNPEDYKIKQAIERSIEVALSTIIKF
jgi:uridine phosphorylase